MKHTLLALSLTAALLTAFFGGRPPAAHAGGQSHSCGMTDVSVSVIAVGNQLNPHYDYWWGCSDDPDPYHDEHYVGDWDSAAKQAHVVDSIQHALLLGDSTWVCVSNPWDVDRGPFTPCRLTAGATASGQINFPLGPILSSDLHVLHAQLQNAINQHAKDAAIHVIESSTTTATCAVCSVLSPASDPAPTLPDLAVLSITGPVTQQAGLSGTYTVTIKNEGGTAAPVELFVVFTGALDQTGQPEQIAAGAGLACEVKRGDPGINAAVRCSGGTLAPGQSATVVVQARGQSAGTGKLVASVNPSHTPAESSYDNNVSPPFVVTVD